MRLKGRMELEEGLKQFDVIPLVNILFLLLVFFMFTSSFVIQPSIKISLPKALTGQAAKPNTLEIVITSNNAVYFDNKAVTIRELKQLFAQTLKLGQSVFIKADKSASLGVVAEIMDLARGAGAGHVNIATDQK